MESNQINTLPWVRPQLRRFSFAPRTVILKQVFQGLGPQEIHSVGEPYVKAPLVGVRSGTYTTISLPKSVYHRTRRFHFNFARDTLAMEPTTYQRFPLEYRGQQRRPFVQLLPFFQVCSLLALLGVVVVVLIQGELSPGRHLWRKFSFLIVIWPVIVAVLLRLLLQNLPPDPSTRAYLHFYPPRLDIGSALRGVVQLLTDVPEFNEKQLKFLALGNLTWPADFAVDTYNYNAMFRNHFRRHLYRLLRRVRLEQLILVLPRNPPQQLWGSDIMMMSISRSVGKGENSLYTEEEEGIAKCRTEIEQMFQDFRKDFDAPAAYQVPKLLILKHDDPRAPKFQNN